MAAKPRKLGIQDILNGIKSFQSPEELQTVIRDSSLQLADYYENTDNIELQEKLLLISNFISPRNANVLTRLANFYHANMQYKKSQSMAVAASNVYDNKNIECVLNAGITSADAGMGREAESFFKIALQLNSNCSRAKFGLSIEYFKRSDIKKAWNLYFSRHDAFGTDNFIPERISNLPRWDGMQSGNLLIYNEQGYGDLIFGIRYIQFIDQKSNPFCFDVDENILSLLNSSNICKNKITKKSAVYRCSILDLPCLLKKHDYYADSYQKLFTQQITPKNTVPRVGLAFSGSNTYRGDKARSIYLSKFKEHLGGLPFKFFIIQKDTDLNIFSDCKFGKKTKFENFLDTAKFVQGLDFVISVDTSVAHLCGALGVKTFVLLSNNPDYRWWQNEKSTKWYDSWVILKQKESKDWDGVFANLADELKNIKNHLR